MKILFIGLALALTLVIPSTLAAETPQANKATLDELKQNQEQLVAKEQELTELNEKIATLKSKQRTATNQAELAAEQLARVARQLQTAELQLERTLLTLSLNQEESAKTAAQIQLLREQIDVNREQLRSTIRSLYQHDQISLVDLILSSDSLGIVLTEQRAYHELQQRIVELIQQLRASEQLLGEHQVQLLERQEELDNLKSLQARQQGELGNQRQAKQRFLSSKQEQQAEYEDLVAEALTARRDRTENLYPAERRPPTLFK